MFVRDLFSSINDTFDFVLDVSLDTAVTYIGIISLFLSQVQGLHAPHSTLQDGTLKPVRPPFLPPPTFETDRPKMPPTSARRSVSTNKSSTLVGPFT